MEKEQMVSNSEILQEMSNLRTMVQFKPRLIELVIQGLWVGDGPLP